MLSNGFKEVMPLIWERIGEQGKNWRIIFKVSRFFLPANLFHVLFFSDPDPS